MAKIDIITLSGLTAGDGSILASGATVKFDSEFTAASTDIRITLRVYRNREVFENGFDNVPISKETLPNDYVMNVPEEEFYVLTPTILYEIVCVHLNQLIPNMFEVRIT